MTDAALEYGIGDQSYSARDYRALFDECPSETVQGKRGKGGGEEESRITLSGNTPR